VPAPTDSKPPAKRAGRKRCKHTGCRKLAPAGRRVYCDDHGVAREPAKVLRSSKLMGVTEPRLFTPPLRKLTRATSRGYEVIEFAELIGKPLLPWQEWLVKHALELNPDGTYRFRTVLVLVARQNGKSDLKRTVSLWRLYMDGAKLVFGVAQDVSLAREQWQLAQDTINDCPELAAELDTVRRVNGDEWFRVAAGGRYKIAAANRKAGRGYSIDELNIDELREQRDWSAWSALSKTTMARSHSQIWAMSNAGDDQSVVLNQIRDAALARRDPSIGIFEWSAEDGCELDDPKGWAQANPGLGHIITEGAIRSAMATDPPNVFRVEVLCQRVDQLDGAVDLTAWKACADSSGSMPDEKTQLIACFDAAPDGKHATLAAGRLTSDGLVRLGIVAAWKSAETALDELPAVLEKLKPAAVAWYPSGPGGAFAPILRPAKPRNPLPAGMKPKLTGGIESVELTGGKVAEVCQGLANMAKAHKVIHPSDPLLDAHIAGAQKLTAADGWRFTRRGAGHVDAAYAAAGVAYVALTLPAVAQPRIRTLA